MGAKTDAYANNLVKLVFQNTNIANIGDATGLRGSSTAGSLYVSGHTASPTTSGSQTSNEAAYGGYLRQALARSSSGWDVSGGAVTPHAAITFPAATSGTETWTHMGIGTDSTGAGNLLYFGAISPTIAITTGVTPQLKTTSTLTES